MTQIKILSTTEFDDLNRTLAHVWHALKRFVTEPTKVTEINVKLVSTIAALFEM